MERPPLERLGMPQQIAVERSVVFGESSQNQLQFFDEFDGHFDGIAGRTLPDLSAV
jgi:hypothetical protein